MRVFFPTLIVFFSFQLLAQEGKEPYYIQQAPVQQMALDCYQRSLDEGLAAQKRGDCRVALRWFREAQSCPELLKVPGRAEELNELIDRCSDNKTIVSKPAAKPGVTRSASTRSKLPTQTSTEKRRRYQPSRDFLLFDNPECFEVTCKEAERAFKNRYWDDAAALFRAAKNCADADQADRMAANARITACRQASQNELLKKEQDAVRQARHALAANRANDARQLLRRFHRSLAYRLADFANEYIAPEDNDACRQAMFDALYYTPSTHAGADNKELQTPFCYQLGDNLGQDLQVCFLGRKRSTKICAFTRSRHLLFQWDANSFEPEIPIQLEDTSLLHVAAVPDGRTLLFLSKDAYLFWRNPREVFRLPVRATSYYCFSADGRSFYFLDPYRWKIYALDLSDAFATRKGYSQRASPEPTGIEVFPGLLNIAGGNGQFWLGYPDSIVAYRPSGANNRLWSREQVFQLAYRPPNTTRNKAPFLWLNPQARSAIYTNDTSAVFFQIPENYTEPLQPGNFFAGGGMDVTGNSDLLAIYKIGLLDEGSTLSLYDPASGQIRYKALVPIPAVQTETSLRSGTFSPDNRMFATTTSSGKLEIWNLVEESNQDGFFFENSRFVAPNSDGTRLYIWRNDSLLLVPAGQPDKILQTRPAPDNAAIPGLLAAQNWLAYRSGPKTVTLTNALHRPGLTVPSPRSGLKEIMGAFHANEKQFACIVEPDSVVLFELSSGQALAGRKFGGEVLQLYFVPQTDEILVVHLVESQNASLEQTVIKLWDPNQGPTVPMRTVRLQGYENQEVAFSKKQGFIAFTNGIDIRVFHQNDLLDETIRIRQNGTHMVTAIEFHPEDHMLAAGYEDGSVVFWDIASGQAQFSWSAPVHSNTEEPPAIAGLLFTEQGRRLQLLFQNNLLLTRDLEVSRVRAGVQTDFRKLISFQPSEIREYDLEQALDYPNNFARLAASGDLPLIRSFFDYFRETAVYSNNVQRVSNSCNRAAALFAQLDAGTQSVLRPTLLQMFADYHWKLLLRDQTGPAQTVADAMKRDFGNPVAAVLASAHTALLQNDTRTAAKQYAEWAIRSAEAGNNMGLIDPHSLDSMHNKVLQLKEYNLIGDEQMDCLCSLFGSLPPFVQICSERNPDPVASQLDTETALRWRIFEQLNRVQFIKNNRQKVQLLESALNDTRQLLRKNPAIYQPTRENVILALGQAYADWGYFEQTTDQALRYYQKALEHLNAGGHFQSATREQMRLANIVANYLARGNIYQSRNQLLEAANSYRQGLLDADRLLLQVQDNPVQVQKYQNDFQGRLHTQLGYIFLLQGNANAALQAFEQAQNDRVEGIHRLYFGHAALLGDNEIQALLEYGNILTDENLGQALFDIEQMATHLPDQHTRLLDFLHRLRNARLQTRQQMDSTSVDYYWAYYKIPVFGAQQQWDSALYWSAVATDLAGQIFNRQPAERSTQTNWLDALLNQSYYLLFASMRDPAKLSRAIRVAQEAQLYFEHADNFFYYKHKALIQTNLAHAYWLRQQAGDRERAIRIYKSFLASPFEKYDPWEMLLKDFRDLRKAGLQWPDLEELIGDIKPAGTELKASDWEDLGTSAPEE